jgi:tRNA pseudouridine synthase 10
VTLGHKFSSSGREDADVLMLGRGRPFYVELTNPKKSFATIEEMKSLQKNINANVDGKISVQDLQICTKADTSALKESASTKSKSYTCMVELETPVTLEALTELSQKSNIQLKQRNPTRVPRRSDLIRDKVIESITIHPVETEGNVCKLLRVDLKTSAGTYVKEFVHGDNGRTIPNLVTLLNCKSAVCLSLDVLEVFLDWPPKINEDPHKND